MPEPEIIEPLEPVNIPTEAPEQQPGLITETPEPIVPEPEPEPIIPPAPEPLPEPEVIEPVTPDPIEPEPEETIPEDDIIVTTAPTILASPDAPLDDEEKDRAVPQSQAAPITTPQAGQATPGRGGGLFNPGGGRPATQSPPSGGTRTPPPGAGGWTLNTSGQPTTGAGFQGLNLDIRCREAERTHLDCPEYIRQQQGRDAQGFESIDAHRNTSIPTAPRRNRARDLTIGSAGTTNSIGESKDLLDSAGLSNSARALTGEEATPNRVRDIFNAQPSTPSWQLGQTGQPLPSTSPTTQPNNAPINNDWIIRQPTTDEETDEDEIIELPPQP